MQLPEYITRDEVKRVCSEIGLRDWSKITEPIVSQEEAAMILKIVNTKLMDIPLEDFRIVWGSSLRLTHIL